MELLIIVALISVLVQLAVPSYRDRMIKAHRLNSKTTLMQAQISLEDCYFLKKDYNQCQLTAPEDYMLTLQAAKHTFKLELQPKAGTLPAQDSQCYRWQVDEKNHWQVFSKSGTIQTQQCT